MKLPILKSKGTWKKGKKGKKGKENNNISILMKKPLKTLRAMQDRTTETIGLAFKNKDDATLERLRKQEDELMQAVDKKEFG